MDRVREMEMNMDLKIITPCCKSSIGYAFEIQMIVIVEVKPLASVNLENHRRKKMILQYD